MCGHHWTTDMLTILWASCVIIWVDPILTDLVAVIVLLPSESGTSKRFRDVELNGIVFHPDSKTI